MIPCNHYASSHLSQGLHALCQADELDWGTCWSVIGTRMNAASHPLIIAALCVLRPRGER